MPLAIKPFETIVSAHIFLLLAITKTQSISINSYLRTFIRNSNGIKVIIMGLPDIGSFDSKFIQKMARKSIRSTRTSHLPLRTARADARMRTRFNSSATMIHLLSNINYAFRMSGKNRTKMLTGAHAHSKHANAHIPLDQIIANASFCFTQLLKIGVVCVARNFPFHTKISHALRGSRAKKISFHK